MVGGRSARQYPDWGLPGADRQRIWTDRGFPACTRCAARFWGSAQYRTGRSSAGAALIAVDGKPARPYRVGTKIEEGVVLQAVAPRKAMLGPAADAPAAFTLEMPPPTR